MTFGADGDPPQGHRISGPSIEHEFHRVQHHEHQSAEIRAAVNGDLGLHGDHAGLQCRQVSPRASFLLGFFVDDNLDLLYEQNTQK